MTVFQFYLSSIKRLMIEDGALVCSSFNSTLVQLKVYKIYNIGRLSTVSILP